MNRPYFPMPVAIFASSARQTRGALRSNGGGPSGSAQQQWRRQSFAALDVRVVGRVWKHTHRDDQRCKRADADKPPPQSQCGQCAVRKVSRSGAQNVVSAHNRAHTPVSMLKRCYNRVHVCICVVIFCVGPPQAHRSRRTSPRRTTFRRFGHP